MSPSGCGDRTVAAQALVEHFRYYNTERLHSALGYLTADRVRAALTHRECTTCDDQVIKQHALPTAGRRRVRMTRPRRPAADDASSRIVASIEGVPVQAPRLETLFAHSAYAGRCAESIEKTHGIAVRIVRHPGNRATRTWRSAQQPLRPEPVANGFIVQAKRWVGERAHACNEHAPADRSSRPRRGTCGLELADRSTFPRHPSGKRNHLGNDFSGELKRGAT